jgi:hypothetical protein
MKAKWIWWTLLKKAMAIRVVCRDDDNYFTYYITNHDLVRNKRCLHPSNTLILGKIMPVTIIQFHEEFMSIIWSNTNSRQLSHLLTSSTVWWSEFVATDPEIRVRFQALPDYLRSSGFGTVSTQLCEYNWWVTWKKKYRSSLEIREYGYRDLSHWPRGTLCPQKVGTNLADKRRSLGLYSSITDFSSLVLEDSIFTPYVPTETFSESKLKVLHKASLAHTRNITCSKHVWS